MAAPRICLLLCFTLFFGSSSVESQADGMETLIDLLRAEKASLANSSGFVPETLLQEIWGLEEKDLSSAASIAGVDGGILVLASEGARAMLAYRERRIGSDELDDLGCLKVAGGPFEASLASEEVLVSPLEEVVKRARAVLRSRVTEVRDGYVGWGLGTLVTIEVIENLGPDFAAASSGDTLHYLDRRFDLDLGEARLCGVRPGFFEPTPGDEILILSAPQVPSSQKDRFRPSLIFPIRDDQILRQPYGYVSLPPTVALREFRNFLLDSEN